MYSPILISIEINSDAISYELSQGDDVFAFYYDHELPNVEVEELNDYDRDDFKLIKNTSDFFHALSKLPH
jgi:hypothetical protein